MTQRHERDLQIATDRGRLWAREWSPSGVVAGRAPILLLHDSLGCIELWRGFPARLADATGRQVVAYDRLGFGRSDRHPDRLRADFVADEARRFLPALLDQLGLGRFIACGHSVGGAMAAEAAASYPDRCLALITVGAQAFIEEQTLEAIRAARPFFADPANLARLAKYHGDKARWVVDAWIDTWLTPEQAVWTLDATMAQVRCPVMAIHGERDEYGSLDQPRRIAGRDGTLHVLDGIGHVPHREDEARLVALIGGFLDGVA